MSNECQTILQEFGKKLGSNSVLKNLWLSANAVGDAGAAALARSLVSNKCLCQLYLHANNIGNNGAIALGKALETNNTLQELWCVLVVVVQQLSLARFIVGRTLPVCACGA